MTLSERLTLTKRTLRMASEVVETLNRKGLIEGATALHEDLRLGGKALDFLEAVLLTLNSLHHEVDSLAQHH